MTISIYGDPSMICVLAIPTAPTAFSGGISLRQVIAALVLIAAGALFAYFLMHLIRTVQMGPKFFFTGMILALLVMVISLFVLFSDREVPLFLKGEGTGLAVSATGAGEGAFTIRVHEDTIVVGSDSFRDPALLASLLPESGEDDEAGVVLIDDYASAKLFHEVMDVLTDKGVTWEVYEQP